MSEMSLLDTLKAVKTQIARDRVTTMAAGLAFYAILSIFPALIALVSLYGLFSDPATVQEQIRALYELMPPSAADMVGRRMSELASADHGALGLGLLASVGAALWSASSGVNQLIAAINVAYEREETRGTIRLRAMSLGITLAIVVLAVVSLGLVAVVPPLLAELGLGQGVESAIGLLRWPALALGMVAVLGWIYRVAPDRDEKPRWRWVSPGAGAATLLWILGSLAFSFYTARFGGYQETYGAIGAVIALLMWLWLSALVILVGAELNYVIERAHDRLEAPDERRELEERYA